MTMPSLSGPAQYGYRLLPEGAAAPDGLKVVAAFPSGS